MQNDINNGVEIALIGNPNCGKTTLFNALTGTYQRVGNWTGVTVEKKYGKYKKEKSITVVDLPGVYSFTANSEDELVVLEYAKTTKPKCIINVLDGTNLERNLYLTCALSKLNVPVILAVNFIDKLKNEGVYVDTVQLEKLFGVPVVEVSALKNINIDKMIKLAKTNDKKVTEIDGDYHSFIEKHIQNIVKGKLEKNRKITQKIDNVVTNKILALPILFLVMTVIYFLSIKLGGALGKGIESFFESFAVNTEESLIMANSPQWFISLLSKAIIGGVGTVLAFLPQILILFCLLTVMEESGYASRVAFITDGILKKFGLSGKSVIPLMVSCGCTVTGLMSSKAISSESERRMSIFLSPFMPCSAKTAVFGWFSGVIFGGNALIAASMYLISVLAICLFGGVLSRFKGFRENISSFVLEIPDYRVPSLKNVTLAMWEKFKDFSLKAGSTIFCVSIIIWFLNNFGISGYVGDRVEQSFLYFIGNALKWIFVPLGFGSWQASVSVLSGMMAKEAVIETLSYLTSNAQTLFSTPFSAYAFMVFILMSPPCMASLITAKKQLKSPKLFVGMLFFQTLSAYFMAMTINMLGQIIYGKNGLIFMVLAVIIILVIFMVSLKGIILNRCLKCTTNCKGNCKNATKR